MTDGVHIVMPNNGGAVYRSHSSLDFYNATTQTLLGVNENDVYVTTIVFNGSAPNANQTHIDLRFVGAGTM